MKHKVTLSSHKIAATRARRFLEMIMSGSLGRAC